jgi:outer membrane protein assembly factor BamD
VDISSLSQDKGIEQIKTSYEKKDWETVIDSVSEYKTRYPYSRYNTQADLMQADAYYQSDKFANAILAYEDFIKKNPTHESAALASYRIAKCYDFQAPQIESRDQSNTKKAIDKYHFYVQNYPNSTWIKEASERIALLERRLADSNAFIAEFYWHTDRCAAALSRYLIILKEYGQYEDLKKIAQDRSSRCYNILANELEKNSDSKSFVYFQTETPESLREKADQISQ